MPFAHNIAELDRLYPVLGHGTRHTFDCHQSMLEQFKHQDLYPEITCKCGLEMWVSMKKVPSIQVLRAEEFGWLSTPCLADT